MTDKILSIIVPLYNESSNLTPFFDRLLPVLEKSEMKWEVICIDDGSQDDSAVILRHYHQKDNRIKLLFLSRNFGKERALSAGLSYAKGDAIIPIDADLQHPPETIPELIARWIEGYEVVYAVRNQRAGQSWLSKFQAKIFYLIFDRLSEVPLPREAGDFRLLDRKVVNVIKEMPERTRFMKGIFAWVGFRQIGVPYEQEERLFGESKFGIIKLISFAFEGLMAFSDYPMRIWATIGSIISGFAFIYIFWRLIRTFLYGIDVPGFESIIAISLFMGGIQLITLGILGHYLGRVFNEVKGRPLFIVREKIGLDDR